jgi:uncharacterized protein (TIGR03067 family)
MAWQALVVVAALVSHQPPRVGLGAGAKEDDLARLQGTWQLQHGVADGEQLPRAECARTRLSIKGRTLWYDEYEDMAATVRLDPAARPAAIDLTPVQGRDRRGEPVKGIYRLDGVLCAEMLAPEWREMGAGIRPTRPGSVLPERGASP